MTPAECNLEFIRIYLIGKPPSAPIRTFLDDWFAYRQAGPFLNKNGRPRWFNNPCPIKCRDALLSMHFVSGKARMVIDNRGGENLIKEHSVPIRVLQMLLERLVEPATPDIEDVLLSNYRLGVITASEDQLLREAGLNSRMPFGWDENDKFARYSAVGITAG